MILISLVSLLIGFSSHFIYQRLRLGKFEALATSIIHQAEIQAETKAHQAALEIKEKQVAQSKDFEASWHTEKRKLIREEERLLQKEDKLEQRMALLEKRLSDIEKKETKLSSREALVEERLSLANETENNFTRELERLAGITTQEAKTELISKIKEDIRIDQARYIKEHQEEALRQAESNAAKIIATAIQRMSTSTTSEITACTVNLPSEEIKGRIIGREGRNIRTFEKITGVNLVMDDTPQAVVISCFDPVRRHIAKLALSELISDGRIHPTTIEESVEKATKTTDKLIQQFGEDAAFRMGIMDFHPEIMQLLGKLKFRYSLGQNVLDHSIEVSHLMGIMATELGLDVPLAKRIGLLHDIGKAVTHEVSGTHAMIGHDLALKYGESPSIANGIGCHHFEIEATTVEGSLTYSADAISASRPGARMEAVDEYVRRLKQMEELAMTFTGIEKAYALQAGRELRVIAHPDQLNDEEMTLLAKNLTQRIQKELNYPGKIKVTLLREKRVVDYAM